MRQVCFTFALFLLFGTFAIGAAAQTDPPPKPQGVKTPAKITKKPQSSARGCPRGSSGRARLKVTFDKSGAITDVVQIKSSGCDSFDRGAIRAAKMIKFEPALLDGVAITLVKTIEYAYSIY